MPTQLALRFSDVPVTDKAQQRYHSIAPCLAGVRTAREQARVLNISYQTVTHWLRQFRTEGLPGLFPSTQYPREPYTPERVIVQLLYFKCCVPQVSDREMARAISQMTGERLHHETVKALLARYFFWRHAEFRELVRYPVPEQLHLRRQEMVRLHEQGWADKTIATLMRCHRHTVEKWRRRALSEAQAGIQPPPTWWEDLPHIAQRLHRKVSMGAIHAILELQKKYGYAGAFRLRGYLLKDYQINLSERTVRKIMSLNRRLHLAPQRPQKVVIRDPREGPPQSTRTFQHTYIDIRYLDAKPEGAQLYSCLLLEGLSRTILAGSLTRRQDLGVVLRLYYLALLQWGCWEEVISDHGGQFDSHAFRRVNHRLQINHEMYEKGHPWQNLIEAQFGIQARLGEYHWERCRSVEAAQEFHRELIRDHNRLPHFAHRRREDNRHAPLEVLGRARGRDVEASALHRAFSRKVWRRLTDARGFVRINRWKIYVEEGLPHTPVEVIYWDKKLRAEYKQEVLSEYRCRWDEARARPRLLSHPQHHENSYQSRQMALFDPLWVRDPIEGEAASARVGREPVSEKQLRLYLGPELVKKPA